MSTFVTCSCIGVQGEFGGELGNQLFQIAAVLGYADKNNCEAIFTSWVCAHGGRDYASFFPGLNYRKEIAPKNTYTQRRFAYDEIPIKPALNLLGSFQSEKYFHGIRDEVRNRFREPAVVGAKVTDFLQTHDLSDYSAFHLRFYDRDVLDRTPLIHSLPEHYFVAAAKKLRKDRQVLIVTNNLTRGKMFAQKHLGKYDVLVSSSSDPLVDFYLLTRARAVIISNSTFGWWGAYLNREAEEIYAPISRKWFAFPNRLLPYWDARDLYPKHFREIPF